MGYRIKAFISRAGGTLKTPTHFPAEPSSGCSADGAWIEFELGCTPYNLKMRVWSRSKWSACVVGAHYDWHRNPKHLQKARCVECDCQQLLMFLLCGQTQVFLHVFLPGINTREDELQQRVQANPLLNYELVLQGLKSGLLFLLLLPKSLTLQGDTLPKLCSINSYFSPCELCLQAIFFL